MHRAAINAFYHYCYAVWSGRYGDAQRHKRQLKTLGYNVTPCQGAALILTPYGSIRTIARGTDYFSFEGVHTLGKYVG